MVPYEVDGVDLKRRWPPVAGVVVIACWLWCGRIMRLPDEERVLA